MIHISDKLELWGHQWVVDGKSHRSLVESTLAIVEKTIIQGTWRRIGQVDLGRYFKPDDSAVLWFPVLKCTVDAGRCSAVDDRATHRILGWRAKSMSLSFGVESACVF